VGESFAIPFEPVCVGKSFAKPQGIPRGSLGLPNQWSPAGLTAGACRRRQYQRLICESGRETVGRRRARVGQCQSLSTHYVAAKRHAIVRNTQSSLAERPCGWRALVLWQCFVALLAG
jgi:hypothetical protein